jgi:hypothetical protein
MTFQKTVLWVFLIILIILLVIIGVTLYRTTYINVVYPKKTSQCPDYWVYADSGKCSNVNNLGKEPIVTEIDLSKNPWIGYDATCNKYKWAKENNISWDGITNTGLVCK